MRRCKSRPTIYSFLFHLNFFYLFSFVSHIPFRNGHKSGQTWVVSPGETLLVSARYPCRYSPNRYLTGFTDITGIHRYLSQLQIIKKKSCCNCLTQISVECMCKQVPIQKKKKASRFPLFFLEKSFHYFFSQKKLHLGL